jgi:hypothetical protein
MKPGAPATLRLADLTADPARWEGKRVQVSGLVDRFDARAKPCVHRGGGCYWSFRLVDSAKNGAHQPVWVVVEAREQQPELRLGEGQKVVVTGRYHRSGCIFTRLSQLQAAWPRQGAREERRSGPD